MKIALIGSGNIATQWGKAFSSKGHQIINVYSRTLANAQVLANVFSCSAINDISKISEQADLYIIAVTDKAIEQLASELSRNLKGLVIHCSGATNIDVLSNFANYGVCYPVQSFSKSVDINFSNIPFGIEANSPEVQKKLENIFSELSQHIFTCSSTQRLAIHISAVIANNFSNALFQMAYDLLKENSLSFDLIKPIIFQTAEKVQNHIPESVQTGPAVRNDLSTINKHLQFLSHNPQWQLIYQQMTELIKKRK